MTMTDAATRAAESEGPMPETFGVYGTRDGKPHILLTSLTEEAAQGWVTAYDREAVNSQRPYFFAPLYSAETVERLRAEAAAARERFEEYGQHALDCPVHPIYPERSEDSRCECGFEQAIDAARSPSTSDTPAR